MITVKEIQSKNELRQFVYLTARLHKGRANWVHPIYMDELSFFDPKKNSSFNFCDHIRLLAIRDGQLVGRAMGLINHRYNQKKNENNARFSYLETENDPEIVHALITKIENWAREKGCERLVGPLGFSDKEPMGYMIEGFDQPILLASNSNMEYQVDLIEKEGYTKEVDMVDYKITVPNELPDIYKKIIPRLERLNKEFKIIEFNSRMQMRKYIRPVLTLTNRAFDHLYGSMPYKEKEMDEFANRFIWFINPNFVKVILDPDGEVVAYVVAMADISRGIQKSKGKTLPFGIIRMLRSGRKSKQLNLMLGAVDFHCRGRGLDVMMALKMLASARKLGKEVMDSHLVLETNGPMRAEYERVGGVVYKRYRIFQKVL